MENKNTEDPRFYNAPIFHFSDRSGRWLLQNAEYVRGLLEILDRQLAEQLDFRGLTPLNRTFLSETLRQQETEQGSQAAQYRRAIVYIVLLILHRREEAEHDALLTLVDEHTPNMEVKLMAQSMADVLTQRGMERGIERGIEIGKTEEKQTAILRIMQSRFQTLPEGITDKVHAITDLGHLDTIFDSILVAETFDDIDWQDRNGQ